MLDVVKGDKMNRLIIIIFLCLTGATHTHAQLAVTTPGLTPLQCVQPNTPSNIVDAGWPNRTHGA
jgi:hypothetical protein